MSVRKANPKIIYASVKAFGEPSPYPKLKGMDIIVQALSGIMDVTASPMVRLRAGRCRLPTWSRLCTR